MKNKKVLLISTLMLIVCIVCMLNVFAHKGRTDANGGHRDNDNQSGLGSYHYHCGGYPAHLHKNGVCPYTSYSSSSYADTSDDYDDGYSDGQNEGYEEGLDAGYNQGYSEGHSDGYNECYDKHLEQLENTEKLEKELEEKSTYITTLIIVIISYLVYKAAKYMRNK